MKKAKKSAQKKRRTRERERLPSRARNDKLTVFGRFNCARSSHARERFMLGSLCDTARGALHLWVRHARHKRLVQCEMERERRNGLMDDYLKRLLL